MGFRGFRPSGLASENCLSQIVDEIAEIPETTIADLGSIKHHHRRVVGDPRAIAALRKLRPITTTEGSGRIFTLEVCELPDCEREVPLGWSQGRPLPVDEGDRAGLVHHKL